LLPAEIFAVTRFNWANAISATRLLLVIPAACAIALNLWQVAAILFAIAVVTDVCDGIVARRRGEVSAFGGLLDHGSDALFVTAALAALALNARVPLPLAPLVIGAFAQYVWDSRALAGAPLRSSVLGRWNGISYYALVGIIVISQALALPWPAVDLQRAAGWLLVVTTLLSMLDRGYALWRLRRG
jgi:phosphatidylglycerophosphate synthase